MKGINLKNARLLGVKFEKKDLIGANLTTTTINHCFFQEAKLEEINLMDAHFIGASFLGGAYISQNLKVPEYQYLNELFEK